MNRPLFVCFLLLFFYPALLAQKTYYISSNGNDANNGSSPDASWKTLKDLSPGNTYLLKRNDTFHFRIQRIENSDATKKITIATYGPGQKPVLNLYTTVKKTAWTKHTRRVWKAALKQTENFTGLADFNSNIGFLKVNGIIYGNKVSSLQALANDWDFFSDEDYLYVYLSSPLLSLQAVAFSSYGVAIEPADNMQIKDISVLGSGGHGVGGTNCKNVILDGLEISEIGGAYLPGFGNGTVRYGNGIEFWNGGSNCIVQNCRVTNVYDVAYTLQGIGASVHFSDMLFWNNVADRNEQSFEAWARENAVGFSNCFFRNNKCSNAGYGWSHAVRPDKSQAVHLLTYTWDVKKTDLMVENNTFYRAKSGLYYHHYDQPLPAYTSQNNHIFLEPLTPVRSLFPDYPIEAAEAFIRSTGKEKNSQFAYPSAGELPLTLQVFTVQHSSDGGVTIRWKTRDGFALSKTEVEHSTDARSFRTLGTFPATDNRLLSKDYSLKDQPSADSTNFYRLKQYDADGHILYSNIIQLQQQVSSNQTFIIYPNPCDNVLSLALKDGSENRVNLKVYDFLGRKQWEQKIVFTAGANVERLDVSFLPKGFYFLQLHLGMTKPQTLSFLKK